MKVNHLLALLVVLVAPLKAGSLEDLRAYLKTHSGQAPIRLKVSGEFRQAEGRSKKSVASLPTLPVNLKVADGANGFQIFWDPAALSKAPESSIAEDLWLTLPNLPHASTAWLDPICLYRTTNPARSLERLLEVSQLEETRSEVWNGQASQRLVLRFKAPLPERFGYRFRRSLKVFPTGTLAVWVAPDGAPLASEMTMKYQVGLGLVYGEFSRKMTQKATYRATPDRIISATQFVEDEAIVERDITRTVLDLKIEEE